MAEVEGGDEPIQLDAFPDRDKRPPPPEAAPPRQPDPDELDSEDRPRLPVVVVWPSSSGGAGHAVGIVDDNRPPTPRLTCTCRGYLGFLTGAHTGCWAMKRTRKLLGLAEPEPYEERP